jgi:hypothetical protein
MKEIHDNLGVLSSAVGKSPKLSAPSIVVLAHRSGENHPFKTFKFHICESRTKKYYQETLDFKSANKEQKEDYREAQDLIPILLLIREVYQEIIAQQPCLADLIA